MDGSSFRWKSPEPRVEVEFEVTGLTGESTLFFLRPKRPPLPLLVDEDVRGELVTTGAGSECLKRGMLTVWLDGVGIIEWRICVGSIRVFVDVTSSKY